MLPHYFYTSGQRDQGRQTSPLPTSPRGATPPGPSSDRGPFIDPDDLAEQLAREPLLGLHFSPHYFQPTFSKLAGKICGGVQIRVLEHEHFWPVLTGIAILRTIHRLYPNNFQWKQPPYECVQDWLPIDVIAGSDRLGHQIAADLQLQEIAGSWQEDLAAFAEMRKAYLLY